MKIVISVLLGCVFGGGLVYLLIQPAQPWALASSGSGLGGVSIRGIFGTEEGCLMFRKLYLMRHKTTAEDHETKVEYYEGAAAWQCQ